MEGGGSAPPKPPFEFKTLPDPPPAPPAPPTTPAPRPPEPGTSTPRTRTPRTPGNRGPLTRGIPLTGLPSQGWDAWWRWHRYEFLLPEHRPPTDDQEQSRRSLTSILIAAAESSDATVRGAAVRALGRVAGARAVPHLLARLRDPVLEVREDAILALGTTGRAAAIHALLKIARLGCLPEKGMLSQELSSRNRNRSLAVIGLGLASRYGSRLDLGRVVRDLPVKIQNRKSRPARHAHRDLAFSKLLFATLAESTELRPLARRLATAPTTSLDLRCRALEFLGGAKDHASLEVLIRGISGTRLGARRSAALALGSFPHPRAVPQMLIAHRHEHEHLTRGFLLVSIGRQGGDEARSTLLRVLDGPKTTRPWTALGLGLIARQQAAEADGAPPDRKVIAALRRAYRAEKSRHAAGAYLIALGMARDKGSAYEMEKQLHVARTALTRVAAAEALALLRRDLARTPILTSLRINPDHATRAILAEVLGYVGRPGDHRVLVSLLEQVTPTEMNAIARGLGVLASPDSAAPLIRIANDRGRSAMPRATAIEALGLMFGRHRGFNLAELGQNSNYTVFGGWITRILHLNL